MVKRSDFDNSVPLPPGLDITAISKAIEYIEKQTGDFIELYFEQRNVFSAIVGMFGTRALDSFSTYEKSKHLHTAQQRFPDLIRRGVSAAAITPNDMLESKGSMRDYPIQSHYNHEGWYIVWRYLVDPTESIEVGKPVIVWRVDVVYLTAEDWKYEGSKAGDAGGGRTHTFAVKFPAKRLKGKAVYQRSDIKVRRGKPTPKNGDGKENGH